MKKNLLYSVLVAAMLAIGMNVQAKEDVTALYVLNADLSVDPATENNGWVLGNNWRQDYKKAEDNAHVNVVEFYAGWGSLDKTAYSMKQTITLPAGDYRLAVNAFYRHGGNGNGTNNNMAWIFAGEKQQNVYALASMSELNGLSGSNDLWHASNAFSMGRYSNEFDFTMEADGVIEIGFEGKFDQKQSWVILGPVKLYKYTLEDYLVDYRAKVAEAEALKDKPMNAVVRAALLAAIVDESTLTSAAEVAEAIRILNEAINAANSSIVAYEEIKTTIEERIAAIDPDLDMTAMWDAYNGGLLESADDLYSLYQQMEIAKLGDADGTDFTKVIINPSFEWGNSFGWTFEPSTDSGAKSNDNAIYTISNADGDYVFNIWSSGNAISQTINGLPNGQYTLTALIATDAGNKVQLNGNDSSAQIDASEEGKGLGVDGSLLFDVLDGTAVIGVEGVDKCWYKVDNFRLVLTKGYGIESLKEAYAAKLEEATDLLPKPMYSVVKKALEDAMVAVNTLTTKDEIMAATQTLVEAIATAKASVAAYEKLAAALEKADALIAAFVEHGASEDSQNALDQIRAAYENGTVADADIDAKIAEISPILLGIAKQQTEPGADMTLLLTNPDFELNANRAEGWTVEKQDGGNVNIGGNSLNHCFEAWNNGGFDVYQTVENAPYGVYEIQVQGFYRYLRDDNAWNAYQAQEVDYVKKQGVPVYVYMNDNATPFTNIFDVTPVPYGELYTTDASLLNPGNTPPYVVPTPDGNYWYPNEMYNSAVAFSQGMYRQSAYGLVAFDGDVLRLGVKGASNQGGDSWSIWDDFKLIYRGFQADVIKPVLEEAVKDVEDTYIGLLMGKTEYAAFTTALADAEEAIKNDDGEAMFKALRDLYAAKDPAILSKDIFLAQEVAADTTRLAEAIRDVAGAKMANTTRANANALLNGIQNNLIYENDQIEQLKQDVTAMIDSLQNSVALYASMNNTAVTLRNNIASIKEQLPQLKVLDDATALCDEADGHYNSGDMDDKDVPAFIEKMGKMSQKLLEYLINYSLMKVALDNLSDAIARATEAGVSTNLINNAQAIYDAALAAFNAGEMGRGDMGDEAQKVSDTVEELNAAINIATAISAVKTATNDAPAYNVGGQKVSNAQKGLIIKNGKKVVK